MSRYFDIVRDVRQNKGSILKASVEYIRILKIDQERKIFLEEKCKLQEYQNKKLLLKLQVGFLIMRNCFILFVLFKLIFFFIFLYFFPDYWYTRSFRFIKLYKKSDYFMFFLDQILIDSHWGQNLMCTSKKNKCNSKIWLAL